MLSEIQRFCLDAMGITIWQNRTKQKRYVVLTDKRSAETQTLLHKMLSALQWSFEETHLLDIEQAMTIDLSGYQKVLCCSDLPMRHFESVAGQVRVTVPALSTLLNNIEAKKRAWKAMQELL